MSIEPHCRPHDSDTPPLRPLPAYGSELLRAATAGGFAFSASRHRAAIACHAHTHATVTMVLEGAVEESYRGRRPESCETASALIRPPGEPHADRIGRDGALSVHLEVEPAKLETLRGHTSAFESLSHRREPALHAIACRMQSELAIDDAATALALEGLALELVVAASRPSGVSFGRRESAAPAWLRRARELLHARSGDRSLRIAELAAAADVHPVHLARSFRVYFGTTPGAYLRRLRLTHAADALASTGEPLSRIALDAGFADQSHFTRAFRAQFGTTPSRWRARHRR